MVSVLTSFSFLIYSFGTSPFFLPFGKESACIAGDLSLIPGSGRFPGEGKGNPLQYSCLENPMDRGVWWATVHGVSKESDMTERLTFHLYFICSIIGKNIKPLCCIPETDILQINRISIKEANTK